MTETRARKRLLSIDGGGIRGIIPLCALARLEQLLQAPGSQLAQQLAGGGQRGEGGLALRDAFDFVAGTSTGAIIAAGIASGVSAKDMLDLYMTRVSEVFPARPWRLPQRILLGYMYSSHNLRQLVERELGAAGRWQLNQSPIDLLITAKRVTDGRPWYFTKDKPGNLGQTGKLSLVDCVTASAAAPTYFDPFEVPGEITLPNGERERIGVLVDGGVGTTGNPVYQACVEAFEYSSNYRPDETIVVSMGTGRFLDRHKPTWIWSWLNWILAELLRSPGEQQTELVQRHYSAATFYRIDQMLNRDVDMDDWSATAELREYGEQLADRVDWAAILSGQPSPAFGVRESNTLPHQYATAPRRARQTSWAEALAKRVGRVLRRG